jgi:hypothetical protein
MWRKPAKHQLAQLAMAKWRCGISGWRNRAIAMAKMAISLGYWRNGNCPKWRNGLAGVAA